MNARTGSVILFLVALTLGAGWFLTSKQAADDHARSVGHIMTLSNDLVGTTYKLTEQLKDNTSLKTNLASRVEALEVMTDRWNYLAGELTRAETEAKAAAEASRQEIERRDKQIAELEGEKDGLSEKMDGLTDEIEGLKGKIADTESKLDRSEGDREQLQHELRRLLAEKAELERKFNDLAILREQVKRLKEELSIAKRIDFIRRGLYGYEKKGAQVLNEGFRSVASSKVNTNQPLKAELGTDGTIKVEAPSTKPANP